MFYSGPKLSYSFRKDFDYFKWLEQRDQANYLVERNQSFAREQSARGAAALDGVAESVASLNSEIFAAREELGAGLARIADINIAGFGMVADGLRGVGDRIGEMHDDLRDSLETIGGILNGISRQMEGMRQEVGEIIRLTANPEKTWSYEQFLESQKALAVGEPELALRHIMLAIDGNATHTGIGTEHRFHTVLGMLRMGAGGAAESKVVDLEAAQAAFMKAGKLAALDPDSAADHARSLLMTARVLALRHDLSAALAMAEKAKAIMPPHLLYEGHVDALDLYLTLAKIQFSLGDAEAAKQNITIALIASPDITSNSILDDPDFIENHENISAIIFLLRYDAAKVFEKIIDPLEKIDAFLVEQKIELSVTGEQKIYDFTQLTKEAKWLVSAGSRPDIIKWANGIFFVCFLNRDAETKLKDILSLRTEKTRLNILKGDSTLIDTKKNSDLNYQRKTKEIEAIGNQIKFRDYLKFNLKDGSEILLIFGIVFIFPAVLLGIIGWFNDKYDFYSGIFTILIILCLFFAGFCWLLAKTYFASNKYLENKITELNQCLANENLKNFGDIEYRTKTLNDQIKENDICFDRGVALIENCAVASRAAFEALAAGAASVKATIERVLKA